MLIFALISGWTSPQSEHNYYCRTGMSKNLMGTHFLINTIKLDWAIGLNPPTWNPINSARTTDISGVNMEGKVNFSWCWGGAVVHDDVHSDIVVVTV